jgi:hypothetical protein
MSAKRIFIQSSVACLDYSSTQGKNEKLSLCLISQALCHEDIWGSGGIASPFLTSPLDGGEWSASCLYPREKSPQYPFYKRLNAVE